jgi:maltooligosyltrehalose trehalohydrolase
MLWQGDEYGEPAPFQFFTDHIDHEIAVATREGRRREFASFAAFAGEEVPDPQEPETFLRSRLTREVDEGLLALHRELIAWRRRLPREESVDADGDESARWLRVRRGAYVLAMNFAREERIVPVTGVSQVELATHAATLRDDGVVLQPLSGALLR